MTGSFECLVAALRPDDVVLGGGNAKKLKELPPLCRLGDNADAFKGGFPNVGRPYHPTRLAEVCCDKSSNDPEHPLGSYLLPG
jgi:hypothetical protein